MDTLKLEPHPEGGYYRETYRAGLVCSDLPEAFAGPRHASTAIYFLLEGEDFSAFHRIASDEMWHFYAGAPLAVEVIHPAGQRQTLLLGDDPEEGHVFQAVVPAGCWFASHLAYPNPASHAAEAGAFALVACTVAPGFDFADFEMAQRSELIGQYPQHRTIIEQLTR